MDVCLADDVIAFFASSKPKDMVRVVVDDAILD